MFYTRTKPWHGLGTLVVEVPASAAALQLAGLDWRVIQKKLCTEDDIPVQSFRSATLSESLFARIVDGNAIIDKAYKLVRRQRENKSCICLWKQL